MNRPALVLVHGLIGSANYYAPERRVSAAAVHSIELLGYGVNANEPHDRLTLAAQAEHVVEQMARRKLTRAWLLGHSMGGAIVMMAAARYPERVSGIINVEGNFTLKDAFWSQKIIAKNLAAWAEQYEADARDLSQTADDWGIAPTPERLEWIRAILDFQSAATIYAMAQAIVRETAVPEYLESVRTVLNRGIPIHLAAGARSAADWDVPDFVRAAARSYSEIPDAGHLMMLEQPEAFCRALDAIIQSS